MTGAPWDVVISIWRSIGLVFLRLPLLVMGSVLLYAFLYAYWLHELPFDIPKGWGQVPYGPLHALIFAPLSLGVIQMVIHKNVRYADVWKAGAISVGSVIIAHEWSILALNRFVYATGTRPLYDLMSRHPAQAMLIAALLSTLRARLAIQI